MTDAQVVLRCAQDIVRDAGRHTIRRADVRRAEQLTGLRLTPVPTTPRSA